MVSGPQGREGRPGPLSPRREPGKAKNRRKKEYRNEDVNGFAAFLKRSSRGDEAAEADGAELQKQVAVALKKDKRREGRRLRRQEMKKNATVSFALSRGCSALRGSSLETWGELCAEKAGSSFCADAAEVVR